MGYAALTSFLDKQGSYGLVRDPDRTPEQWAAYLSGHWMLMSQARFEKELLPFFQEFQRMGDELVQLRTKLAEKAE